MNEISQILQIEKLTNSCKILLLYTITQDGRTTTTQELARVIKVSTHQLSHLLKQLIQSNIIEVLDSTICFSLSGKTYKLYLQGYKQDKPTELVRKARTLVDVAREKLNLLRTTSFVGRDVEIYNLSLVYDRLFLKYSKKMTTSLSPITSVAKNSKTWKYFERTYNLIQDRKFNNVVYLEAQFQAVEKHGKKFGCIYPYPSMLASQWAIENYEKTATKSIQKRVEKGLLLPEQEMINSILQSSHLTVSTFQKANPEMSLLQSILILQDQLSPVYLAISKEYLGHINNTQQELSEDIVNVLYRLNKDKEYGNMVKKEYKEMI